MSQLTFDSMSGDYQGNGSIGGRLLYLRLLEARSSSASMPVTCTLFSAPALGEGLSVTGSRSMAELQGRITVSILMRKAMES